MAATAAWSGNGFPQDTVDIVGFYSTATKIRAEQLPLVMPKQISTHEYMVSVKIPLDQALPRILAHSRICNWACRWGGRFWGRGRRNKR